MSEGRCQNDTEVTTLMSDVRRLKKEVRELQSQIKNVRDFIRAFAPTPAEKDATS